MQTTQKSVPSTPFAFDKFLPGLVLGVVVGGFAGAFGPPFAHAWLTMPADPIARTTGTVNTVAAATPTPDTFQNHADASTQALPLIESDRTVR